MLDLLTPHLVQASARAVRMTELATAVRHLGRQADRLDLAQDALPGLTPPRLTGQPARASRPRNSRPASA